MFLYRAVSSPLDSSKRFTLFAAPLGRHVHSDTKSASLGSILAMQQLRATTTHSQLHPRLVIPPSVVKYSFIYIAEWIQVSWKEQKFPNFETVAKKDSNPVSLDCESGVLLLRYRAP